MECNLWHSNDRRLLFASANGALRSAELEYNIYQRSVFIGCAVAKGLHIHVYEYYIYTDILYMNVLSAYPAKRRGFFFFFFIS